ncbi:MAG: nucleoside phosphorylase [Flavobacteriales bacterium]
MEKYFSESELILRPDKSVYHLGVKGEDLADDIIIVGDPDRVAVVTSRFDSVRFSTASREFCIQTGEYNSKEISVVSTGIGVDNIDIVINELDAAVNINPDTRLVNKSLRKLSFLRLGTSGALDPKIKLHDIVCSAAAIGMDGVPHFYDFEFSQDELAMADSFSKDCEWPDKVASPYAVMASKHLLDKFEGVYNHRGITITANGFYGPQNRELRGRLRYPEMEERYRAFSSHGMNVTNFEMETAGIYALSKMLGHSHLTLCVILTNRINKEFSSNPEEAVNLLINKALDSLSN